jgi:hypothetical protein
MIEERPNAYVVRVYVKETGKYSPSQSFSFKKWGGKRRAKEAARIANDRLEENRSSATATTPSPGSSPR